MFILRPYQQKASDAGLKHLLGRSKKPGVVVCPTGCHGKGEMISMANGTKVKVEDLRIGDKLVGDDGTNRTILCLHRGVDDMYRITPIKGNPFIVNGNHLLSLYKTNEKQGEEKKIDCITVNEYINKSNNYKHLHKLYKPKVINYETVDEQIVLDPCFVTGFSVENIGKGEYFGFELDGNHLYCDGQLFVHHNSGKSLIISELAKRLNAPCLILQPSKEILEQNYDKAIAFGMSPTIYSASCGVKELSGLTYATLKSIKNETDRLKDIGIKYILIDEAHSSYSPQEGSEFMDFIKKLDGVKTLGFTATPCRLHAYSSLMEGNYSKLNILTKDDPHYFEKIVYVTQVDNLVANNFWANLRYERWEFDTSALTLNNTRAEYTAESISECIVKSGMNNTIYRRLLQLMNERNHILVAMDSVKSCDKISSFMNERMGNITAVVSSGTSKKKRQDIINDFKSGKLKVVFNYSALSTGFDFPELDCIILGRPTFSFSYYYQVLGRAVRTHPDKKEALIVDCCDNYSRFGRIEDLSIEEFPGKGWCMFSGNKLISGIHMGDIVTREELIEQATDKGLTLTVNEDGRRSHPWDNEVMWFGKYNGIMLKDIPIAYFRYIVNTFDSKSDKILSLIKYYKEIIL